MPRNDDFAEAARIMPGQTVTATTRNATRELGEPPATDGTRTIWFRLNLPTAAKVALRAAGKGTYPGSPSTQGAA